MMTLNKGDTYSYSVYIIGASDFGLILLLLLKITKMFKNFYFYFLINEDI